MSYKDKLSKEDRKRHFTDGGKGDCIFRGRLGKELNNEKQQNYRNNSFWDTCEFEKKRQQKEAEMRMKQEEEDNDIQ